MYVRDIILHNRDFFVIDEIMEGRVVVCAPDPTNSLVYLHNYTTYALLQLLTTIKGSRYSVPFTNPEFN